LQDAVRIYDLSFLIYARRGETCFSTVTARLPAKPAKIKLK
jgi:hypothetical protein